MRGLRHLRFALMSSQANTSNVGTCVEGLVESITGGTRLWAGCRHFASDVPFASDPSTSPRVIRSELFHRGGFIDRCIVRVEGGDGGRGAVHWIHRKGQWKLAAGGRGGDGGAVVLQAASDYVDLSHLQFVIQADPGGRGGEKQSTGARGADTVIKVPPGTTVFDISHLAQSFGEAGIGQAHDEVQWEFGASTDPVELASQSDSEEEEDERTESHRSTSTSSQEPKKRGYGVFSTLHKNRITRVEPLQWVEEELARKRSEEEEEARLDMSPDEAQAMAADEVERELEERREEKHRRREQVTQFWDQYLGPLAPPDATDPIAVKSDRDRLLWRGRKVQGIGNTTQTEVESAEDDSSDAAQAGSEEDGYASTAAQSVSITALLQRLEEAPNPPPVLADLTREGQSVVVALGGEGGKGNYDMPKEPGRPQPSGAEHGAEGECKHLLLELKCIADVGLVGFPNAGKSTLLRCLTAATPRVANYPFTTLRPYLGSLVFQDGVQVRVADLPGIIEGASEDKGLGLRFLRHIERTRALAYVIDSTSGVAGTQAESDPRPWVQLKLLRDELRSYSPRLLELPSIVVLTKIDRLQRPKATIAAVRKRLAEGGEFSGAVFPVSHAGFGYEQLRQALRLLVDPNRLE